MQTNNPPKPESFSWDFPYASRRSPVMARNVVATSQPLAAQAGLQMLHRGGNAVDAALAAAIALTVLEPTSNGIGSDAFAIIWDGQSLHGLNASGRSPAGWTRDRFDKYAEMPMHGWDSITVPGAPSAWSELSHQFGKLPFAELFEPAIRYARDGYLVTPVIASQWAGAEATFGADEHFAAAFLPAGRAPRTGELFRFPDAANTLEKLAASDCLEFYEGAIAERIAKHARSNGGAHTKADFAAHKTDWVGTVHGTFAGYQLHEIPPNGQGIAAPMMLGILQHLPISETQPDSAESLHLQIEAMKLAFADAYRNVADPTYMHVTPDDLLDAAYLAGRAQLVTKHAQEYDYGLPRHGGTVYLTAADAGGMMVSFIQSNYWGFGSGVVVPGTGVSLQNRGYGFTLERGHPNEVGPEKRPFHTIIPGFVMRDGEPVMSFGVMGGSMQAQGHAQMMIRMFIYGQNPQAASDAPRWRIMPDGTVTVEAGFASGILDELVARGHRIEVKPSDHFGGAQLILKTADGYIAASDSRKDGQAVGY